MTRSASREGLEGVMSESVALELLRLLVAAFPPLAAMLSRFIPDEDEDPLVSQVRAMLPSEGASAAAVKELERFGVINEWEEP